MSFGNPLDDLMGNPLTEHVEADSAEISSVTEDAEVIVDVVDDHDPDSPLAG